MNEIAEILAQQQTAAGAQRLKDIYFTITGHRHQSGCLCKGHQISKTYNDIRQWAESQTKN